MNFLCVLIVSLSVLFVSCSDIEVNSSKDGPTSPTSQRESTPHVENECYYKTHMNKVPSVPEVYFRVETPLERWMPKGCYIWHDDDGDFDVDICYRDIYGRVDWTQSEIKIVNSEYCE